MAKKGKKNNYDKVISKRFTFFFVVILLLFSIIFLISFKIMVFDKNKYNEELKYLTYTKVTGNSSPRGRIYDRNYNLLVDNKSVKTITYRKTKGIKSTDMIKSASEISKHIDIDYSKLNDREKREYFFAKNKDICDKLVTKGEIDKVKQRKISERDLDELKIKRIKSKDLDF